jgi:predicted nucleotidyltransferase
MGTINPHLQVTEAQLADFCRRWQITELALFGSVVRDDFRPESDVDVMVTFAPGAHRSLWDVVELKDELTKLFGREVDVMTSKDIRNPFRRRSIERDLTVVYAA